MRLGFTGEPVLSRDTLFMERSWIFDDGYSDHKFDFDWNHVLKSFIVIGQRETVAYFS